MTVIVAAYLPARWVTKCVIDEGLSNEEFIGP